MYSFLKLEFISKKNYLSNKTMYIMLKRIILPLKTIFSGPYQKTVIT